MKILREETVRAAAVVALQKLVTPHVEILTGAALSAIISARDKPMLVQLYNIIQRVTVSISVWVASPLDSLLAHYKNDIFERVREIVTDTSEGAEKTMVDRLLELKEFLDECTGPKYLDDMEKNDRKYIYATSEAFERGFGCRKIKPAELIGQCMVFAAEKMNCSCGSDGSQICGSIDAAWSEIGIGRGIFRTDEAGAHAVSIFPR
jgi:hypothetical protein